MTRARLSADHSVNDATSAMIDRLQDLSAAMDAKETGVQATGTITCVTKANFADTDFMTIGDGLSIAKVYEFDTAGNGVTAGRIQVNISGATTAQDCAVILKAAIDANQPCLTSPTPVGGVITLTHAMKGVFGNVTITENVANAGFLVTGMSGGLA